MDDEGFRYDLTDGLPLVEGFRRVLEDHLDVRTQRPHFALGESGDIVAVEPDGAPGGFQQADNAFANG